MNKQVGEQSRTIPDIPNVLGERIMGIQKGLHLVWDINRTTWGVLNAVTRGRGFPEGRRLSGSADASSGVCRSRAGPYPPHAPRG